MIYAAAGGAGAQDLAAGTFAAGAVFKPALEAFLAGGSIVDQGVIDPGNIFDIGESYVGITAKPVEFESGGGSCLRQGYGGQGGQEEDKE